MIETNEDEIARMMRATDPALTPADAPLLPRHLAIRNRIIATGAVAATSAVVGADCFGIVSATSGRIVGMETITREALSADLPAGSVTSFALWETGNQ